MDKKFYLIRALTRHLPRTRGMIRLAKIIGKAYIKKGNPDIVLDVFDFKMRLTPGESLTNDICILAPQLYEYREVKFLRKNLKSGDIFIDIGAHIGFYSLLASQIVGETGVVVGVEADPSVYEKFLNNIRLNNFKNIIALNYGVSDKKEIIKFGRNKYNTGKGSFLNKNGEMVDIQCLSLADIVKHAGVEGKQIQGLKIDTEGFEYKILKPFLLNNQNKNNLPQFIIVEYDNKDTVYQNKLTDLLERHYKLIKKNPGNYIFIKKDA